MGGPPLQQQKEADTKMKKRLLNCGLSLPFKFTGKIDKVTVDLK